MKGKKSVTVVFTILVMSSVFMCKETARADSTSSPAIPGREPPDPNEHWYAGSQWTQSLYQDAREVYGSIQVPCSAPLPDDQYAMVISAWDSNDSYDQIGIAAYNGKWELIYSWTTFSGPANDAKQIFYPSENYWSEMELSCGATYNFSITVQNGVAVFSASEGGTVIWSQSAPTGGGHLDLATWYWANYNGITYGDYTNYEEVWNTQPAGSAPAFNFNFTDQNWVAFNGSSYAATWTAFTKVGAEFPGVPVPRSVTVLISGNSVLVVNYSVDIAVTSVDPLPPRYDPFQVYHDGMRLNGQSISMTYVVTVSRTDSDPLFPVLVVEVGLKRTNVDNASDFRVIATELVLLGSGSTQPCSLVWNEMNTTKPGTWSITGFANSLESNTFDTNPSDNQVTNDTVHAEELIGDIDGSGSVNILDSVLLANAFYSKPGDPKWNVNADLNMDNTVNILDAILLASDFGDNLTGSGGVGGCSFQNSGVKAAMGGNPSIVVDPCQITVFKGEFFSVNVSVTDVTDLQGWEFKLYWNSTVLNCTNAVVVTPTVWQNSTQDYGHGLEANYNSTHARFWKAEAANYPAPSFNGSTTIATLTFQAIQPGTTSLTLIDTMLGDSAAQPIACTVSGGSATVYNGRYMRSDTQTVNGLNAYKLNVPESNSSAYSMQAGEGIGASWGIRVWVRHSNGSEQEISLDGQTGTPKAVVSRSSGSGIQSATVTAAQTAFQSTDSLVIRVYAQVGDSGWTLCATFTTEQLEATTLQATTWTVYYYTYASWNRRTDVTTAKLYWGTTTYNTRIQNLQYT